MANYYYKSEVQGNNWLLSVVDGFDKEICQFIYPSFTTDKLSGQLIPDPTLVDAGIMKNIQDTGGLEKYLRYHDWIAEADTLLPYSDERIEKPVIEYGERIKRAKESDLILLPESITGTNCFNCRFIKKENDHRGFCENPKVAQEVSDRMCCCYWDAEGTKRISDMLMNGEDKFAEGGTLRTYKSPTGTITKQYNIDDGHLSITQTVIYAKSGITKINEVSKFNGTSWEPISESDPDASKAFIMLHNAKISGVFDEDELSHGGITDKKFDEIVAQVTKQYEGKPVAKKYRKKYGRTYSEKDAKSVGYAVATTIDKKAKRSK